MDSSPREIEKGRTTSRLNLIQQQLNSSAEPSHQHSQPVVKMAARDPITCHCLNTLTGTPAANLPVTLTLLSAPASASNPVTYHAVTNADGRVGKWTPTGASTSVPEVLSLLPNADSKTNWSVRFDVGPWYEAQGIESFWPEVEVKFTVKGRGREGEEGWRHYHVPVLLGPWNYSTYRGS